MENIVTQGMLYDFYGELLTEHQRRIYEDLVYQDMSLSEIAERTGLSYHMTVKKQREAFAALREKLRDRI